jgi:anaerobic magnesium-protoporphyrin IX monomethyl ester cyclase
MKIGFVEQCFEKLAVEYLMAICERAGAEVELFLDPTLFADAFYDNSFLGRMFDVSDKVADRIVAANVDLLAFSVVSDDYLWAVTLAKKVKARRNIPTVFGGVHPTAVPEYVAANPAVDYVCQGEGEEAIIELMACLASGHKPTHVDNLCFFDNGRLIKNPLRKLETNMDLMPFPDKDRFYEQMPVLRKFYMTITSKYCPFRCTFCYNSTQRELYSGKGKYLRQRSPENVIEELTRAKKYNYQYVLFNDDILPFNRRWVREFAPLYQKHIGKPFFCYFHPQYADKEIVRLLADAGCVTANMGIQSLDAKVRGEIFDRWETNDDIGNAVRNIMERKIFLNTGHIIGYPGDSEEIQENAAHFYADNPPSMVGCYWLRLYPGTKITQTIMQQGGLTADEIEQINRGEGKSFWLGGSVKNMEAIQPFSVLLNCMPLLPNALFRFLLKKKRYRALKKLPHVIVMIATRFAQLLFNIKDIYGRWGLYLLIGRINLYFRHLLRDDRQAVRDLPARQVEARALSDEATDAPIGGPPPLPREAPGLAGRAAVGLVNPAALIQVSKRESAREMKN